MAELAPLYLIHGDDHGAVAERRASLRALAEREGDAEVLEDASVEQVATALCALTLTTGRRVIIADGVERWREEDAERDIVPLLAAMPPDTTLALVAREDERSRAPAALHRALTAAGGRAVPHMTLRGRELAAWVREQGARLSVTLDNDAAHALIEHAGERQQRLLRELERLSLEQDDAPDAVTIGAEEIYARSADSAELQAARLAALLVAGEQDAALRLYLGLARQGAKPGSLAPRTGWRLLAAARAMRRLQAGERAETARRELRMAPADARAVLHALDRSDSERLERAVDEFARLEVDTRGGAAVTARRRPAASLAAETVELLALRASATS
ncbi:MAG TPA: hypothetical protein VMA83_03050 [Solirubrobacteraceae bacterium]|nr:hypothetical protein [Solirubrobacteraceae bacterium]